jgi:hypothetical protein
MDYETQVREEAKKAADKYSLNEMRKSAGKELYCILDEFFGGNDLAMPWFYSRRPALGGNSPYQCCLAGEQEKVKTLIGQLSHGVFI